MTDYIQVDGEKFMSLEEYELWAVIRQRDAKEIAATTPSCSTWAEGITGLVPEPEPDDLSLAEKWTIQRERSAEILSEIILQRRERGER